MEQQETYRSIEAVESLTQDVTLGKQEEEITNLTRISSIEPPPNGGWVAWSQVLGGHIVTFFVWGFIVRPIQANLHTN